MQLFLGYDYLFYSCSIEGEDKHQIFRSFYTTTKNHPEHARERKLRISEHVLVMIISRGYMSGISEIQSGETITIKVLKY